MIPIVLKGLEDLSKYTKESCIGCVRGSLEVIPHYQERMLTGVPAGCLSETYIRTELINRWISCILEGKAWNATRFVESDNTGFYAKYSDIRNDYGTNLRMVVFK